MSAVDALRPYKTLPGFQYRFARLLGRLQAGERLTLATVAYILQVPRHVAEAALNEIDICEAVHDNE